MGMRSDTNIKKAYELYVRADIKKIRRKLMDIIEGRHKERVLVGNKKEGYEVDEIGPTTLAIIQACKVYEDMFGRKVVSQKKWEKDNDPKDGEDTAKDLEALMKEQEELNKVAKRKIGNG
jgi:hypothetical protein